MKKLSLLPILAVFLLSFAYAEGGFGEGNFDEGSFDVGTPAPSQEQPAESSSTSKSKSGGGGGGAAAVSNIAASEAHFWQVIRPNQKITFKSEDEGISISEITVFNGDKELKNVELWIEALTQNPVSDDPEDKVYQYLRLNKRNIEGKDVSKI